MRSFCRELSPHRECVLFRLEESEKVGTKSKSDNGERASVHVRNRKARRGRDPEIGRKSHRSNRVDEHLPSLTRHTAKRRDLGQGGRARKVGRGRDSGPINLIVFLGAIPNRAGWTR